MTTMALKRVGGFRQMMDFGVVEALLGRRSRRFFMGAEIPDGLFAYKSRFRPKPLSDLETLLVVSACRSNTSWQHMMLWHGEEEP